MASDLTANPNTISETHERARQSRLVTLFGVFMLAVSVWLPAPVVETTVPGNPMEFRSASGEPLNVYALTVRLNHNNAETVKNWWHVRLPDVVVEPFADSKLGIGQDEARWKAKLAVRELSEWDLLPPSAHTAGRVSGTSSGLGWALAMLAQNDPEFLADLEVATTGTISSTGDVMPVGSVSVKVQSPTLATTDVLFVPLEQYADAESTLISRSDTKHLILFGVRNIGEAVGVVCVLNPGSPTCTKLIGRVDAGHNAVLRTTQGQLIDGEGKVVIGKENIRSCQPEHDAHDGTLSVRCSPIVVNGLDQVLLSTEQARRQAA